MSNLSDRFHRAPFVRILLSFVTGIILAEWISPPKSCLYWFLPLFVLFFLLFFSGKKSLKQEFFTGILILIVFVLIGFSWNIQRRYEPINLLTNNYYAILDEYPTEKTGSLRATIKIQEPSVKAIAYFEKSEELKSLEPGMVFYFYGKPELIRNNGNPFEFDYRKYSLRNDIGHRIYLSKRNYLFLKSTRIHNLKYRALVLREKLLKQLDQAGVKGETFRVISAITFGARDHLDPETTKSFTRTGTIHVLAVSGGNVAVIYFFLYLLFGFLNRKRTIFFFTVLVLSGIWAYTFITGLSPSVLRASIMFSFILVGKNIGRNPDISNILASSAFVLLFSKPSLLFDAGFQLSYTAVMAIIFLQPVLYRLCFFKIWILDKIWILFTVSIAAQIGTFPFSIWYFHQFPVYFWITNVMVIPLVSFFLYLALTIILFNPLLPSICIFLARLLTWAGDWMLKFLYFIEHLPAAVIENIYPSAAQLLFCTLFFFLTLLYFIYHKSIHAMMSLLSLVLLLLLNNLLLWQIQSRREIVFFNSPGKILVACTRGRETTWITDGKTDESGMGSYIAKPYEGFRRINQSKVIHLDTTTFLVNKALLYKNSFLNFCGLRMFFCHVPETVLVADVFSTDFLVTNSFSGDVSKKMFEAGIGSISLPSVGVYYQNKALHPEETSSGEGKALKIVIEQKKAGKINFRIKYR